MYSEKRFARRLNNWGNFCFSGIFKEISEWLQLHDQTEQIVYIIVMVISPGIHRQHHKLSPKAAQFKSKSNRFASSIDVFLSGKFIFSLIPTIFLDKTEKNEKRRRR